MVRKAVAAGEKQSGLWIGLLSLVMQYVGGMDLFPKLPRLLLIKQPMPTSSELL